MASWLDRLADQSRFPTGSGLDSCSRGGAGDTGGGVDCLAMGPALAMLGFVESGERMVGAVVGLSLDLLGI